MNEYSVDDYRNLDSGAENIDSTISNLNSNLQIGTNSMNSIMNETTFNGPVANHCAQVWQRLNKHTQNSLKNFSTNASTIRDINANYQGTDDEVSTDIGGI